MQTIYFRQWKTNMVVEETHLLGANASKENDKYSLRFSIFFNFCTYFNPKQKKITLFLKIIHFFLVVLNLFYTFVVDK